MSAASRWPLHPAPAVGEALSSWISRVAAGYDMTPADLLNHNLGPASTAAAGIGLDELDLDPPAEVLAALSDRTGLPLAQIRQMTIAGWVPWLLDQLEPGDGPQAFDTYVHQDSVLLRPRASHRRSPTRWRAWLPIPLEPMRRACPRCLLEPDSGFTLFSQIPLVVSCPEHGCRLEATFGKAGTFLAWAEADMQITAVDPRMVAVDRRTQQGLATGRVTLPRRGVHVGVWFRLLRTLLDEVNIPVSHLSTSSRAAMEQIWQATGHRHRMGENMWRPFEVLPWDRQSGMLHAAAVAVDLVGSGVIEARGTLGHLLHAEPYRPAGNGEPDRWRMTIHALEEAIAAGRQDPEAAQQLLGMFTALCASSTAAQCLRASLIDCGIPASFLPPVTEYGSNRQDLTR